MIPYLIASHVVFIAVIIYLIDRIRNTEKNALEALFALFMQGAKENRLAWFSETNARCLPEPTIFLGDSLIQEYLIHECFPGRNLLNRGIGGDTTEGVLKRLETSVFTPNPKAVILLIGTNDLALTTLSDTAIADNIIEIVDSIKAYKKTVDVYVLSLLPVNETNVPPIDPNTVQPRTNGRIRSINKRLETSLKRKSAHYIDIHNRFIDSDGNLDMVYTREGLHLNPEGYKIMTDSLRDTIK